MLLEPKVKFREINIESSTAFRDHSILQPVVVTLPQATGRPGPGIPLRRKEKLPLQGVAGRNRAPAKGPGPQGL